MDEKLIKLRQGVALVSPEERQHVEKNYTDMINQWRRRKRMFKDVWDAITENSPKNPKEFKALELTLCLFIRLISSTDGPKIHAFSLIFSTELVARLSEMFFFSQEL